MLIPARRAVRAEEAAFELYARVENVDVYARSGNVVTTHNLIGVCRFVVKMIEFVPTRHHCVLPVSIVVPELLVPTGLLLRKPLP